jgi:hypothetical protein
MPYISESSDIQSLFLWYGKSFIMTVAVSQASRRLRQKFKEDYVQIQIQISWILSFRSHGPV